MGLMFSQRPGLWRTLLALMICGALPSARGIAAHAAPVFINADAAGNAARDDGMQVACGAGGVWVAVWVRPGSQPVDAAGNDAAYPDSFNEDLVFARSTDGGRTWSAPAPLKPANPGADRGDDISPSLATDGQGRWMVVWRSMDPLGGTKGYDADILMSVSSDNGQTWSAPQPVNNDAFSDPGGWSTNAEPRCFDYSPHVCADGQGRWMVAWTRCDNRTSSLGWKTSSVVASSADNGLSWSTPLLVQTRTDLLSIYTIEGTALATDRQGRWIMTWSSRPNPRNDDYDIYYSVSANGGASWSSPAMLNANGPAETGEDQFSRVATDGLGHWLAVWQTDASLGGGDGTDTDLCFSVSNDNGATWSAPAALNSDAGADGWGKDYWPCPVYDGAGKKWVVAWTTDKLGGDYDILYATCPAGAAAWSAAKPLNPWAASDMFIDSGVSLASNGQDSWMSAWCTNYNFGSAIPQGDLDLIGLPAATAYGPRLAASANAFGFQRGSGHEVNVELNGQPTEQNLALTNEGTEAVQVSAIRITGPHAADFSLNPAPATPLSIPWGASSAFKVRFAPTEKTYTLNMNATLEIVSNDPRQTTLILPLAGDAVPVELGGFSAE